MKRVVDVYKYARLNPKSAGSIFVNGTVLMLNSPTAIPSFFGALWTSDKFRACADGASNRLFDRAKDNLHPHLIVGDLDSARQEVLRHYEARGTLVARRPCQDTTDFEKLIKFEPVSDALLHRDGATAVLGGLGGLLSHQLANMNALLRISMSQDADFRNPLMFLDERETCLVLRPGVTRFEDVDPVHCALVPLFGEASHVTTKGLRWDLKNQTLSFGGLVSTSNECKEGTVEIMTEQPLLWIFETRADAKN
jgi:thiamine pyrophosphokinase